MPQYSPAKKSLGQNFLVDRRIVTRIIAAAELTPEDTVLEVGPGRGTLTRPLAEYAASLTAIELDDNLATPSPRNSPHNLMSASSTPTPAKSIYPPSPRRMLLTSSSPTCRTTPPNPSCAASSKPSTSQL